MRTASVERAGDTDRQQDRVRIAGARSGSRSRLRVDQAALPREDV